MTSYPFSIDSTLQLPTVSGGSDEDIAINALIAAVIAVETELGVEPHGVYSDVATRLSILESRVGTGPDVVGGPIDINSANFTGALNIARGGTAMTSTGAVNTVLTSAGATLAYKLLDNSNIDAAAAIAGTKISPNFGSQNLVTTGNISVTNATATGTLTVGSTAAITGTAQAASFILGSSGPTVTTGTGAPGTVPPNGSLYMRQDGTTKTGLYVREAGAWTAIVAGMDIGGSTTQVQFNDAGAFGGDAGLTYDKTSNVLSVSDAIAVGSSVATTGLIRVSGGNRQILEFRNNAGAANISALETNTSDELFVGTSNGFATQAANIRIHAASGVFLGKGSTVVAQFNDTSGVLVNTTLPITMGTDAASAGTIRLKNTDSLMARNAANGADLLLLSTDASDNITLGDSTVGSLIVPITTVTKNGNSNVTVTNIIRNVATTDATVTDIYTWAITNSALTTIDVLITAISSDCTLGASYKRTITFRRNGGVVFAVGTIRDNQTDEDSAAWDVTIDDDGAGTGRVRVTGDVGVNITWGVVGTLQVVIP